MVKGKRQSERRSNGSLIKELDAAIALLSRARALASSNDTSTKAVKPTSTGKRAKRKLSTEAREAYASARFMLLIASSISCVLLKPIVALSTPAFWKANLIAFTRSS